MTTGEKSTAAGGTGGAGSRGVRKDGDGDLRTLAFEVIQELREALRSGNAEALARSQGMIETSLRTTQRRMPADALWRRMREDPATFLQGDYLVLRSGLGRRQPDGSAAPDMALQVGLDDHDRVLVSGPALERSDGVVIRTESGEEVVDLRVGEVFDQDSDGRPDWVPRVTHVPARASKGLITAIAFDQDGITGVGSFRLPAVSALS